MGFSWWVLVGFGWIWWDSVVIWWDSVGSGGIRWDLVGFSWNWWDSVGGIWLVGSGVWWDSVGDEALARGSKACWVGSRWWSGVQHKQQRSTFSSSSSSSSSATTGSGLTLTSWLPLKPGLGSKREHFTGRSRSEQNHVPPPSRPAASPLWASQGKRPPLQSARCCCCCCSPTAALHRLLLLQRLLLLLLWLALGGRSGRHSGRTIPTGGNKRDLASQASLSLCIEQLLFSERDRERESWRA